MRILHRFYMSIHCVPMSIGQRKKKKKVERTQTQEIYLGLRTHSNSPSQKFFRTDSLILKLYKTLLTWTHSSSRLNLSSSDSESACLLIGEWSKINQVYPFFEGIISISLPSQTSTFGSSRFWIIAVLNHFWWTIDHVTIGTLYVANMAKFSNKNGFSVLAYLNRVPELKLK